MSAGVIPFVSTRPPVSSGPERQGYILEKNRDILRGLEICISDKYWFPVKGPSCSSGENETSVYSDPTEYHKLHSTDTSSKDRSFNSTPGSLKISRVVLEERRTDPGSYGAPVWVTPVHVPGPFCPRRKS